MSPSSFSEVSVGEDLRTYLAADAVRTRVHVGIPFAKPPLGDLRFAPPVAMNSFGVSTFNATAFGAPCVQPEVRDARPCGDG